MISQNELLKRKLEESDGTVTQLRQQLRRQQEAYQTASNRADEVIQRKDEVIQRLTEVNETTSNRANMLDKEGANLREQNEKQEDTILIQSDKLKMQEALVRAKCDQIEFQKHLYKADRISDQMEELDSHLNRMFAQWKAMKVAKGAMSDKCGVCLTAVKDAANAADPAPDAPDFKWVVFRCGHVACDNCIQQYKMRTCHVCHEPLQDFDPLQRMGSNFRPAIDLFDEYQKSMDKLRKIQQKIGRFVR